MKVLLTGASGFVGRHVAQCLVRRGHSVVAIGRVAPALQENIRFLPFDLLGTGSAYEMMAREQPNVLVHSAWFTAHGEYLNSSKNFEWISATTRLVDDFLRAGGQRVLGVGTCAEYDWSAGICDEQATPLHPRSLYGAAKKATRHLLRDICRLRGMEFCWARVFFLYGPGESRQRLIPSVAEVMAGRRNPFRIDGEAARDFLHVYDVAAALAVLAEPGPSGDFNICSGKATKIADVVRLVAKCFEVSPEALEVMFAPRLDDPRTVAGSNDRLLSAGWTPSLTLESGLREAIDHLALR